MRRRSRACGAFACTMLCLSATAAGLRAQSPNIPPEGLVFRDPFVNYNGDVIQQAVAAPDSIEFREPFLDGAGVVTNPSQVAPPHIDFRSPFVDPDGNVTLTAVTPPGGLEFRPVFLNVDGYVLIQDLDPPQGIVFRDPFLDSEGNPRVTAVPGSQPERHLLQLGSVTPNPFNPGTQVSFHLREAAVVTVSVLDLQGRVVRVLQKERLPADLHVVSWDGRDHSGRQAASGVYIFQIRAGAESLKARGVLLK